MAALYNYSSTAGEYTLQLALTPTATSVQLDSVTGLPSTPFKLVIEPGQPTEEIVKVTTVAGTSLTVVRGWDGTNAVSHDAPCKVRHMMTAEDLRLSRQHEDSTAAHGATGAVVGTTGAQALKNKNLTDSSNTFPSSLATLTGTQTLTNKNLSSSTNTFPSSLVTLTGAQSLSNKLFTGNLPVTGDMLLGDTGSSSQYAMQLSKKSTTTTDYSTARFSLTDDGSGTPVPVLVFRKNGVEVNRLSLAPDGSIAYGAYGSKLSDTGIVESGFVQSPGWSIATAQYWIKHGTCQVYVRVKRTGSAITPPVDTNILNVEILKVPGVIAPSMPVGGSAVADGPLIAAYIWTDGVAGLGATAGKIDTNDYISLSFTYLV